jgi:hypothetical protein
MSDLAHLALVGTSAAPTAAAPVAADDAVIAANELAALKADSSWVAKHLGGSHETKDQVERLTQRMHAKPAGSVQLGAGDAQAQRNEIADFMRDHSNHGLSAAHIEEIRSGRGNSPEIYAEAERLRRSLVNDPKFVDAYMKNDHEARRTMLLLDIIRTNGVRLENR